MVKANQYAFFLTKHHQEKDNDFSIDAASYL